MEQVNQKILFKYSEREDYLNYLTHGLGAVLSLCGLVYLLVVHNQVQFSFKVGIVIYSLSMFALFSASSLYHHEQNPKRRAFLKRMDHAMILVMISGTYAPLCIMMGTTRSYTILAIVYVMSIIGIALKVKFINVSRIVSIIIYLVVGWLAVFMISDMINFFNPLTLGLIVAGGLVYSVGAIVYACANFEYHHALWHLFVVVAAMIFFVAINLALYM